MDQVSEGRGRTVGAGCSGRGAEGPTGGQEQYAGQAVLFMS